MTDSKLSKQKTDCLSCAVNVRHFGARGDNNADDTKAIQSALDSLVPQGGCLCLPPGTYLVSDSLRVNAPIEIRGVGRASVIKATTALFHVFELRGSATGGRLTDFQIQGAARSDETDQVAIQTDESLGVPNGITIDHLLISGPDFQSGCNNGILLDRGASDWKIDGNVLEHLIGTSSGHGYGVLLAAANRNIVCNNHFIGSAGQGRHAVYQSSGASFNLVTNNIVRDFTFEAFPIFAAKDQIACQFNQVSANIIVNANDGVVNSGQFTHDTAAIGVYGNASNNSIAGNTIIGFLGVGILLSDAGSGGLCTGNQVGGNSIFDVGLEGIRISGAKSSDVKGNVVLGASRKV